MTDYRDNMTLGEMADNDLEMAKVNIKNAKRVRFFKPETAFAFQADCVKATLDRLGLDISPLTHPKIAQRRMDAKNVRVETREKYKGENQWRCGIYIYQNGELVTFVSSVFLDESGDKSPFEVNREDEWFVYTNAKGV